ncbi:hypothetical protein HGRIS_013865 [Hohenbuehelia grisea]|uniref:Uncharacterized protein n=1 Tax=Hohenbuehelia grisea TaxID=104357 RepID=A0ABR3IWT3_9AGAR
MVFYDKFNSYPSHVENMEYAHLPPPEMPPPSPPRRFREFHESFTDQLNDVSQPSVPAWGNTQGYHAHHTIPSGMVGPPGYPRGLVGPGGSGYLGMAAYGSTAQQGFMLRMSQSFPLSSSSPEPDVDKCLSLQEVVKLLNSGPISQAVVDTIKVIVAKNVTKIRNLQRETMATIAREQLVNSREQSAHMMCLDYKAKLDGLHKEFQEYGDRVGLPNLPPFTGPHSAIGRRATSVIDDPSSVDPSDSASNAAPSMISSGLSSNRMSQALLQPPSLGKPTMAPSVLNDATIEFLENLELKTAKKEGKTAGCHPGNESRPNMYCIRLPDGTMDKENFELRVAPIRNQGKKPVHILRAARANDRAQAASPDSETKMDFASTLPTSQGPWTEQPLHWPPLPVHPLT